jgi:hypothetical protein
MKILTRRAALLLGLFISLFTQTTVSAQWVQQNIPPMKGLYKMQSVGKKAMWSANASRSNLNLAIDAQFQPHLIQTQDGGITFKKELLFDTDYYFIEPYDEKTAYLLGGSFSAPIFLFKRTLDGGATWEDMPFQPPTFPALTHFYDANNGIYLGDPDELGFYIAYTTDGGNTFNRLPQSNLPQSIENEYFWGGDYQILGDNIFMTSFNFVTGEWRMIRSTNRGRNWTAGEWFATPNFKFELRFAFTDANNGMALNGIGTTTQKPLYTTNGGATWHESGELPSLVSYPIDNVPNTQSLMAFFQDTSSGVLFTALTNDLGKTWNTRRDIAPYELDARYKQFGLDPFVNGQLEIVDNHTAWAQFTNFAIHHYDSSTPIVPEKPDLDLSLTADKQELTLNIESKYTLKITNRGISAATGIRVKWAPPVRKNRRGREPFEYQGSSTTKGDYDSRSGIWTLKSLAAGESALVEIFLKVVDARRDVVQTAEILRCREKDLDSTPGNMFSEPEEDDETYLRSKANSAAIMDLPSYEALSALIMVSPNPASDKITIAITPDNDSAEWSVKVMNSLGQTVFTQKGEYSRNLEVDTQKFNNGLYFIEYQSSSEQKVEKVLVQH